MSPPFTVQQIYTRLNAHYMCRHIIMHYVLEENMLPLTYYHYYRGSVLPFFYNAQPILQYLHPYIEPFLLLFALQGLDLQ